jgi:Ca2+/Na+ antiporter
VLSIIASAPEEAATTTTMIAATATRNGEADGAFVILALLIFGSIDLAKIITAMMHLCIGFVHS